MDRLTSIASRSSYVFLTNLYLYVLHLQVNIVLTVLRAFKLAHWYFVEQNDRLSSPDFGANDKDRGSYAPSRTPTPQLYTDKLDLGASSERVTWPGAPNELRKAGEEVRQGSFAHRRGLLADGMSFRPLSSSQEFVVIKEDSENDWTAVQPDRDSVRLEFIEHGMPLGTRRDVREHNKKRLDDSSTRQKNTLRDEDRHQHRDSVDSDRETRVPTNPIKASSNGGSKHKRPGNTSGGSRHVMKNDLKAKKAVIREIEGLWGRGFIKSYIPRCHRPLAKRGNSKRSAYREHETDPENWLPSVLKAMLMIAKLTDDKQWLKKAMNDVVRYRIKHTGNRKPQLVTTDFFVIEDILVKQWTVPFSIEIRYKHILFQSKDEEVDDVDIDRIMGVGSDHEEDNNDYEDDCQEQVNDKSERRNNDRSGEASPPFKQRLSSNSAEPRQHSPPTRCHWQSKQSKARHTAAMTSDSPPQALDPQQPQEIHSYAAAVPGYSQFLDPWGRPVYAYVASHVYNHGHSGFGGYKRYGPPSELRGAHHGTQPYAQMLPYCSPIPHAMTKRPSVAETEDSQYGDKQNKRRRSSSVVAGRKARAAYSSLPSYNMHDNSRPYPESTTKIKSEPNEDEDTIFADDWAVLTNEFDGDEGGVDEEDVLDAEVEAMELELELADLKAARLRDKGKGKSISQV